MPPKKTNFVKINTALPAPILPGRQRCDCLAMKHDLVNNCLSCGRIVCFQEGAGPCMFCGDVVMDKTDRAKVASGNTKEAQRLIAKYNKLQSRQDSLSQEKEARATKERLLEYDRTSAQRTKVIDDQSDYFATESPWLSEEEKKVMKEKKAAYEEAKNRLKRKTKVTIDFAGRRIIEEVPTLGIFEDLSFLNPKAKIDDRMKIDTSEGVELMKPEFLGNLKKENAPKNPLLWSNRLQDPELQEMVDAGNCLSVTQPYATLVMDGIKKFEGRSWYTPIRGRLWISSGQKSPTPELVASVQACYRHIVGDIAFPSNYPTGALLGCVDLLDCIPQEEYLELYPTGEVSDPYVLVLANPQLLRAPIPISGKSKIFKLDTHVLQAAKKVLF